MNALPRPILKPSEARDRILETASSLFYTHGIHAVGIDKIIATSNVAKMTFYKHFPSKSKLVAAYLAARDLLWQESLNQISGKANHTAQQKIELLFDLIQKTHDRADFRGCPFVNGFAEFDETVDDIEIGTIIRAHYKYTRKVIQNILQADGINNASTKADIILTLITGSSAYTRALTGKKIANACKDFVAAILND